MEDLELKAMQDIFVALEPLEAVARARVLSWVKDRLGVQMTKAFMPASSSGGTAFVGDREFKTFADLYNNAQPTTNGDKALVAGYWLQICLQAEEFPSQQANKELQNLGHALVNITDAFNQLKSKKPALAIQVKKSGKSQQARKQYKLTQAGIDLVKTMLEQNSAHQ